MTISHLFISCTFSSGICFGVLYPSTCSGSLSVLWQSPVIDSLEKNSEPPPFRSSSHSYIFFCHATFISERGQSSFQVECLSCSNYHFITIFHIIKAKTSFVSVVNIFVVRNNSTVPNNGRWNENPFVSRFMVNCNCLYNTWVFVVCLVGLLLFGFRLMLGI